MKVLAFISIIQLLILCNVFSQKTYNPEFSDPLLDKYRWRHYEELSGKNFTAFCEGKNGTMWFGIGNGAAMYDGYKWTEYHKERAIGELAVRAMAVVGDTLYYASDGIRTLINGTWSAPKYVLKKDQENLKMARNGMFKIYDFEVSGDVLIAAATSGIYIRKNGIDHLYTLPGIKAIQDSIFPDLKYHGVEDFGEGVLIRSYDILDCGNNTFYAFVSGPLERRHIKFRLTDNNDDPLEIIDENRTTDILTLGAISSIIRPNGEIWLVSESYEYGLNILRNNEWETLSFVDILNDTEISGDILNLSDNSILVTSASVIYRYDNTKWSKIKTPNIPFNSQRILAFLTKSGDLWLGDWKGEVYKIDYSNKHFSSYENLNYQFTHTDGSLWFISNDEKVVFKKDDNWYYYDNTDGLPDAPQTLYLTKNGTIWCGGSHKQVSATAYLNDNKWIKQCFDSLSWSINYNAVIEGAEGELWFGGASNPKIELGQKGGMLKIKLEDNKTHITPYYNLQPEFHSFEILNNTLYAGTGAGLVTFEKGGITSIYDTNKTYGRIKKTATGALWVATMGDGVLVFNDNKKKKAFTTKEGLNSDVIFDVYPFNNTSVWVATNRGYSYYNGEFWFNDIFPEEFIIGTESGKLSVEKEKIWISRFSEKWTRRVYEMNKNATTMESFFSIMYTRDTIPPETEISFYFPEVNASGNTTIKWKGNDYMHHTPKDKLLYSYRINNQEWSQPNGKESLSLLGLKSGDYVFEVRAYDKDMNVDLTPAKVTFTVIPPVWKQAWFILMLLFFFGTVMFLATRIVIRNKKLTIANMEINKKQTEILKQQTEIYRKNIELARNQDHLEHLVEERTQQLKKAKEKAEESDKLKSAFLANMSHEIRTPMNAIIGFSKLLDRDNLEDERRKRYRKLISINSKSLLVLLDDIIDISLIESDQITMKNTNFDLNSIFVELERNMLLNKKGNVDICMVKDSMHDMLMINNDAIRLKQVVYNLLNNAIKFTEKGFVKYGYEIRGKELLIFVSDTGIGIKKENFENIFNHFYKVEEDKSKLFGGTGIGLSICKKIVELMNGKIWVESELNKGTTFYVNIPLT